MTTSSVYPLRRNADHLCNDGETFHVVQAQRASERGAEADVLAAKQALLEAEQELQSASREVDALLAASTQVLSLNSSLCYQEVSERHLDLQCPALKQDVAPTAVLTSVTDERLRSVSQIQE